MVDATRINNFEFLDSPMPRLARAFFARYTPEVARELLGCIIVRRTKRVTFRARIVEVEAYRGPDDPASHAFRGVTKRTAIMFGEPGHAYLFFVYGNHFCLNATTEGEGVAGAVLIRAAEPLQGIEWMKKNRGVEELTNLMSGPGKLTKAMGIDGSLNGEDLVRSNKLYFLEGATSPRIGVSTRIGLSAGRETEWRFYEEGSPFVSAARTHNYRNPVAAGKGSSARS
jgi:DNA-3-methyladenine glycosylase